MKYKLTIHVDLPGPPCVAQVTYWNGRPSIAVVQLSETGSPPIIQVVLVAMTPNDRRFLNKSGLYMHGDQIVFNLSSLADHDVYAFAAYASNYAGDGPYSAQVTYSGETSEICKPQFACCYQILDM